MVVCSQLRLFRSY